MTVSKILIILAAIFFLMAAFGDSSIKGVALVPLGLACYVVGKLFSD